MHAKAIVEVKRDCFSFISLTLLIKVLADTPISD
jgi:hypothetical protein